MNYIPLHVHTAWSLLDSTLDVDDYVNHLHSRGFKAAAITDHNNIKALVPFYKKCKAKNIKPIIGCEIDIWQFNKPVDRITLICKNKNGYKNLLRLLSTAKAKSRVYEDDIPKFFYEDLKQYSGGIVCLVGDVKSRIFNNSFVNPELAYNSDLISDCDTLLKKNAKEEIEKVLQFYKQIYNNVFLYFDYSKLPALIVLGKFIKNTFEEYIPCNNIHYLTKEDINIHDLIISDEDNNKRQDDLRIFKPEYAMCHILEKYPDGEKTLKILDLIEDFSIEERPMLPEYKIEDHKIFDQDELLRDYCRNGFSDKIIPSIKLDKDLKEVYLNRIKHELEVFKQAKISGYFLVVSDIVKHTKNTGLPIDSRGSSSGCLISYLLNISSINPIIPDPTLSYSKERELPFERFYNEGRNTASNVSLPDIDIDLPPSARGDVLEYIRKKYGKDCVAHIITHSRFKGKGALKEAFRILKPVDNYFDVANEITKLFIDEAKISDELVEIQEEDPSYGIIRWNIDNIKSVADAYEKYRNIFDFAIRIERLPKNESVHAAGIIVSDKPLETLFPMTYSRKLDQMIIDVEGVDIEFLGGVKFDILGVSALEKIYQITKMINNKINYIEYGVLQ